ncbi:MAG: amidohydrolase family protein [Sulfolobales archaeon]
MRIFEKLKREGLGIADVHVHGFMSDSSNELLIRELERFGVKNAFTSIYPFDLSDWASPSHQEVLKGNMKILELSRKSKSIRGVVYVNLLNKKDVDMAERFLREGFRGIGEVYRSVRPRPSNIEPYVRLAIEHSVPVLIHVAHRLYPRSRAREAEIKDLCLIARRWPRAKIIASHISGGGDWENTIEMLRLCEARNLYIDTGGSVGDSMVIERLVRDYYADNILFGSDNLFAPSIARIESADISDDLKVSIYRDNPCKVFSCD